jgi:uncharacterized protein (DUF608 family)
LSAATKALLLADPAERAVALDPAIVDVSHGEGVPIGTLGAGYSLFGRSGFQRVSFDGVPDMGPEYSTPKQPAEFAFYLTSGKRRHVLQQTPAAKRHVDVVQFDPAPVDRVDAYAELPKAHFRFEQHDWNLAVVMTAFSPLIAHDIESSTVPVQVFELTVQNTSHLPRDIEVRLSHVRPMQPSGDTARLAQAGGEIAFAADGGSADSAGVAIKLELAPGAIGTARFFIAWYFPSFRTASPAMPDAYRRLYARRLSDVAAVLDIARREAHAWSEAIDRWRASFDVPPRMKRLWFSSLASVVTSTMLSDDPYFFAIEAPHEWVNTMDVAVYANWVYLVNWPDLERMDLEQYFEVIPTGGEDRGFVWHSIWSDATHYAEEPTFITRLWRAHLWFNDRTWLETGYPHAVNAANCAYRRDQFEHLLVSKKGNQSYDEWMMPGASAYVNLTWLHALYCLERMAASFERKIDIGGRAVPELRRDAAGTADRRLWTDALGGYWKCFFRTPGAAHDSLPEAVFTDQLFGRWVTLVDHDGEGVLPPAKVAAALRTIYTNNLLDDPAQGFRGWPNSMLPGGRPDAESRYHARTCWFGAQLDLASLLGASGAEAESLDVFNSVEASLRNNHLAAGEWNRSVDANGRAVVLPEEPRKDTPRFPPYPRYTCSWEYLIRMIGLQMDGNYVYLSPFRSLAFGLDRVRLAGMTLTISVEPNWVSAMVDGRKVGLPVKLERVRGAEYRVEFSAAVSAT